MRFSLFRRSYLTRLAAAFVCSFALSTAFAQDAAVDANAATLAQAVPQNASKADLVAFQAKLTQGSKTPRPPRPNAFTPSPPPRFTSRLKRSSRST